MSVAGRLTESELQDRLRGRLQHFRRLAGLSQRELDAKLGLNLVNRSRGEVRAIERGSKVLTAVRLGCIAEALHQPVQAFFADGAVSYDKD